MATSAAQPRSSLRLLDVVVLIFPIFLVLAIVVMIWSLQAHSDQPLVHPSVGIFHSGELATQNGITGTVEVTIAPAPIGNYWHLSVRLLDQDVAPIKTAVVYGHGVEDGRFGENQTLSPGAEPGTWTGTLLLLERATSVMVHADLPGGSTEEWVAEWKPKGVD